MLTKKKVKEFIKENCSPSLIGISNATPFKEDDKKRFRECMRVLKEGNPFHSNDQLFDCTDFLEDAKSVIVIGNNSYFGQMASAYGKGKKAPVGEIGNFYMNENILNSS